MRVQTGMLLTLLLPVISLHGCAAPTQMVYVTDAQEVSYRALEPVSIDGDRLREEMAQEKFRTKISRDRWEDILSMVKEQIARTKRFTIEEETLSVGKNYIIQPHIEEIRDYETVGIPTDPTRKKILFKARVRMDVLSIDSTGALRRHASFSDTRVNEIRVSAKELPLPASRLEELFYETVEVAFKAASNRLGTAFNPSYVTGRVTRVAGKKAYISIDTSRIEKMPKMKWKVEVMDENDPNRVVAVIESLKIEPGESFGDIFETAGRVKEGAKIRALVNDLQQ